MDASLGMAPLWGFSAILILGIFSSIAARRSEGSPWQTLAQVMFFALLAVVGSLAIGASMLGPGCWAAASMTLAVMVLAVTYDPRRSARGAAW